MTTVQDLTPIQKEVLKYLNDHDVTKKLNNAVNKLSKARPDDPLGFLARLLQAEAKPPKITRVVGREILDSRGNPTVEVDVYALTLGDEKLVGSGSAPSGASTGSNECLELRDGDEKRYLGKGTLKAVGNVNTALSDAVRGLDPRNLKDIDAAICKADGTQLKQTFGGNALTAVSFASAHAGASLAEKELFLHLATFFHPSAPAKYTLPRPMVNILNGGKHAGGDLRIQEFMIVPKAGNLFSENLRIVTTVYHHLSKILVAEKGPSAKNLGDEGGFAPPLKSPHETLQYIERAIEAAGFKVGVDVFLALDCAASEFFDHKTGKYEVEKGHHLSTDDMVKYYLKLKKDHPALISIEDGLDEKDYDGWIKLTSAFNNEHKGFMLVGDDLYTTNTELIAKGVAAKWANALLLKVNQIGTISEAMNAARMIFNAGGNVAVSHRSGETADTLIADLAVAIGAQFIKTGATARGERVSKYNRLLQIEEYLKKNNLL
jgi:enolase